ncbi:MAG: capsule biosynthesis protein [Pseudomonadales bacterium]
MADKRVLLLQGPMGPFFWRLRQDLQAAGATVRKINFCGGDELFYPRDAVRFAGASSEWPQFLERTLHAEQIDAVMLFGDCRPYHLAAAKVAGAAGVAVYAFEEGYLRPDFVTVERGGCNNRSSLPRNPNVYRRFTPTAELRQKPQRVRHVFRWATVYASLYCVAMAMLRRRYPHYRHHRSLRPWHEIESWTKAAARKLLFRWQQRGVLAHLSQAQAGNYYLVPLQVQGDAQICVHSRFASVAEFIETVVASFAAHAPKQRLLVIKHHPLDRGYSDYRQLIAKLAARHGLGQRLLYVHDLHLPLLLRRACGTVVINSTVGLSSVHHGTPVCALGETPYQMPGLTYQGSLDAFWGDPGKPDAALYRKFRAWLRHHNQANGNFYTRLTGVPTATGIRWPALYSGLDATSHEAQSSDEPERVSAAV